MEVLHDPWLCYVTFFNVVNVTFIVTCQPSVPAGKNLDEGFLTQPMTAYHLCPALPLLLQRPCHPFQSVADQHRSKQIFSDSCLSLLTWKLQNESNHSGFCSIKMHQNALIVSELHDYKANAEPEPLSHLCRVSFTSKGTTGEAALGRNLGCAGFCNSGTWVFKVWTKAKGWRLGNSGLKRGWLHSNQDCMFRVPNQCQWIVILKIQSGLLSSVRNSVCVEAGCLPLDVPQSANFLIFQPTCQLRLHEFRGSGMISLTH